MKGHCRRCGLEKQLPYAGMAWIDIDKAEARYHWCRDCLDRFAQELIGTLPEPGDAAAREPKERAEG
ncbi:MAG TPA: hypothetical protein VN986_03135 [Actinomycetota bacterium]|nr:hypothetical protein [Actinomycetota bacterium]